MISLDSKADKMLKTPVNIAILASGNGSNAENIARYFKGNSQVRVALILSNKLDAFVLERAARLSIPSYVFDREEFYQSEKVLEVLNARKIDFIVLAGFLWLVPDYILRAFPGKIVNIHPALLPKFGGKGMYGDRVHQAVIQAGEKETGISIHMVNEKYDEGQIVFQDSFRIMPGDTPETIAGKVHELEYKHFPVQIERLVKKIFL